ncbi:CG11562 [Drosophila busckii]|uniref:CG11562 n=1 Tax=Drosophila busckii TaxID=30019 RepID=A0A0M3QTE3_DROBS|nr:protein PET117 homolog, mitochondrial [Drosophila busckii]ALC38763.1 CG11562 [Drosophila busckii]
MSLPSKITLGIAVSVSAAIIGYVHYKQSEDRLKLHQGVLRDIEQQQRRKHENTYTLQQQIDLTKQYKSMESAMVNVVGEGAEQKPPLDVEPAALKDASLDQLAPPTL